MVLEIQFNYCQLENVTNLISLQIDASIQFIIIIIYLQYLKFIIRMLENFCRISNRKMEYLHRVQLQSVAAPFRKRAALCQNQAVQLIQNQLYIKNIIMLGSKLTQICINTKVIGWNRLKANYQLKSDGQTIKKKAKKYSVILFIKKLQKLTEKIHNRSKLEMFKQIERFSSQIEPINRQAIKSQTPKQGYLATQSTNNPHNSSINSTNIKKKGKIQQNNLSILDISEIAVRNKGQIILTSNNELTQLQINNEKSISADLYQKERKQVHFLRSHIREKYVYIGLLEKQHSQEIHALEDRLAQLRNRAQGQESIQNGDTSSTHSYRQQKKEQKQKQASSSQILASKLIKKNFELQQKLQTVYQLLGAIIPDTKTAFGQRISTIIRKKCFHISFQDQTV